jgi:dethiobiotin synthetase
MSSVTLHSKRLLLVSTEASPQVPPSPNFGPLYLSTVLIAYTQQYGPQLLANSGFTAPATPDPLWSTIPLEPGTSLETLWQRLNTGKNGVFLYAVGSLASPLTPETTVADLAGDWRLETILVVPLNHRTVEDTLAYAALAQQRRCPLKGIVFCAPTEAAWDERFTLVPPRLITDFTHCPILGTLPPWQAEYSSPDLAQVASQLPFIDRWVDGWVDGWQVPR